ncbi:MAG: hypothetical protein HQL56_09980 [Magnetococcales bacterium]|nr:hypothetical protein [Magnetococcales bacterium]
MSLLTLVQQAADTVGVPRPATVINNSDRNVQTLLSLAQFEGVALSSRGPWQEQMREATFTTTAGVADYPMATIAPDFSYLVKQTLFDRSNNREISGPLSPHRWQTAQLASGGLTSAFRIREGQLRLTPTPTDSWNMAFEYCSRNWCRSAGGVDQSAWMADSDTGILSEYLMTLGLIWRFLKAKGLAWGDEYRVWQEEVKRELGRSGGAAELDLGPRGAGCVGQSINVPESGFGP